MLIRIGWHKKGKEVVPDGGAWRETKRYSIWSRQQGGDSDQIVQKIARLGVIGALREIEERCAIAILDKEAQRLWLAADHLGSLALYYGQDREGIFFSGNLGALRLQRNLSLRIDPASLALFLQYGYILSPWTILDGIGKVSPGSVVMFDLKERSKREQRYWNPDIPYLEPKYNLDLDEAVDLTERSLIGITETIRAGSGQIGAFLSGGYDSTLLALLLQRGGEKTLHTYTIGFGERGYDEAPYAQKIADYLKTVHTTYYLQPDDLERLFYRIGPMMDEPLGDQALIPSMVVADLAQRDGMEYLVGGDGGDEIFGANSYMSRFSILEKSPRMLRRLASLSPLIIDRLLPFASEGLHTQLYRYARMLRADNATEALKFKDMILAPDRMQRLILGGFTPHPTLCETASVGRGSHFSDLLFSRMLQSYVFHDLVAKMCISTETGERLRVALPYLERSFIEKMAHIDYRIKNRNGPKSIQRQLLQRHLPGTLTKRPKRGFSVPIMAWLQEEQRWIVEHFLSQKKIEEEGLFDPDVLLRLKDRFMLKGRYPDGQLLWNLLMFELWYEEWKPSLSDHGVSSHIGAVENHGTVASGEVPKQ